MIRAELKGAREILFRLNTLSHRAEDLTPAFHAIAAHARAYYKSVFDTEGETTDTGRFTPLAPRYREWKARHFPGRPILTREGRLRASLTQQGALGHIEQINSRSLVFGTSIAYARAHQEGTDRLPERPYFDPPPRVVEEWRRIVRDHLLSP